MGGGQAVSYTHLDVYKRQLEVGKPVEASRCGSCKACQSACPPQAILGNNWAVGIDRGELVKIVDCREGARDIAAVRLGKRTTPVSYTHLCS